MLRSMTGFGSHKERNDDFEIKVDIRSVNNRYLDIQVKGPKSINFLEDDLKKTISKEVTRGKVDVFIDIKFLSKNSSDFQIDYVLLDNYLEKIREMSSYMTREDIINPMDLLKLDNNILTLEKTELSENENFVNLCKECLKSSLANFLEMKSQEGYNIEYDLKKKINEIKVIIDKIEKEAEHIIDVNVSLLRERIDEILSKDDIAINEDRLVNEIVFYTDKLSIDEELVRLNSHLILFENILSDNKSNGKKLDFIIQELNRETNTIGSKSSSVDITNEVISMKSIIEKMREQVQNIE